MQRLYLLKGEISDVMLRSVSYAASRMNEFYVTGTLRILANKHGTVYVISPENENLIDRFLDVKQYKENTSDDVRWVVRKYLFYLEQKGFMSMAEVYRILHQPSVLHRKGTRG